MHSDDLVRVMTDGLLVSAYLSLPPVVVAALTGLATAFVQAVLSMQDQTVAHGVKLVAVIVTILAIAPWGCQQIASFTNELMTVAFSR